MAAILCKGEVLEGSACCTVAAEISEAVQGFVLRDFVNLLSNKLIQLTLLNAGRIQNVC